MVWLSFPTIPVGWRWSLQNTQMNEASAVSGHLNLPLLPHTALALGSEKLGEKLLHPNSDRDCEEPRESH